MYEFDHRQRYLTAHVDLSGLGLEVGPGCYPVVPKRSRLRIETADCGTADELRMRYESIPGVDAASVEPVDFVSRGASLLKTIGEAQRYDYILASHVLEHVPDMLGFLRDCEALLKPAGRLVLAVPDKRACFDVLHPISTTGQVLQAHLDKKERPGPGAIFDALANTARLNNELAWPVGRPLDDLRCCGSVAQAKQAFDRALDGTDYIDVHVWRFVPSSLRLIIKDLNDIGALGLRELNYSSAPIEICAVLAKDAPGCDVDRATLLRQALIEQAAIAL